MNDIQKPKLIVLAGEMKGQEFLLDKEELTIGRDQSNKIVISHDVKVSRNHCRISNHLGFVWLEDLQSSNGTYLTQPGDQEMRLAANQPALLLDTAQIRVGIVQFQIIDICVNRNDAVGIVGIQLQEVMEQICTKIPKMSPQMKQVYEEAIQELAMHLRNASSEKELVLLVAKDIQKLSAAFLPLANDQVTVLFDAAFELPPIPDSLPEIDSFARVDSIRNLFISDIKRCLPPDENEKKQ